MSRLTSGRQSGAYTAHRLPASVLIEEREVRQIEQAGGLSAANQLAGLRSRAWWEVGRMASGLPLTCGT